MKLILCFILMFSYAQNGFGQTTNFLEAKYHQVSKDVASVKTYTYPFVEGKEEHEPSKIEELVFVGGFLSSMKELSLKYKVEHHYDFFQVEPNRSYEMHYKRFKNGKKNIDSTTKFQAVNYKGLTFYFPKKDLQIVKDEILFNDRVEMSFTLDGKKEIRWLETLTDSTVTEIMYDERRREMTYHKNGNLLQKLYPRRTVNKYYYNDLGVVISQEFNDKLMNRNYIPPIITKYYYKFDAYGNWIKKLAITYPIKYTDKDTLKSFSARELTYNTGVVTGKTDYDFDFMKSTIKSLKN